MSKRRNVARRFQVSQRSKVSLSQRPLTVTEFETSKLGGLKSKTGLLDAQCDMKPIADLQKGNKIGQYDFVVNSPIRDIIKIISQPMKGIVRQLT